MLVDLPGSGPVNLVSTGAGVPVVLLHSAALDLTFWDRVIAGLRGDHRVIAIDLPGHGATPGTQAEFDDVATIADRIALAVGAVAEEPVHLGGLSVGGVVAQSIAVRHPDLVRSLVLMDTSPRFPDAARGIIRRRAATVRSEGIEPVLPALLEHWLGPAAHEERPDLVDRVAKTVLRQDPGLHAAMWELIARVDLEELVSAIALPTLVLVGEHDDSSPPSTAQRLADLIDGARVQVLPGASHLSPVEQPDVVTTMMRAFFRTVPTGRARPEEE